MPIVVFKFKCLFHSVNRQETERLLYSYRAITGDRDKEIDRVKFRDLLHDHFGMSDDFFMDRGVLSFPHLTSLLIASTIQ